MGILSAPALARLGLAALCWASNSSYAVDKLAEAAISLASERAWHDLVLYKPTVFGSLESAFTDPDYFVAADGRNDSLAELQGSISRLYSPNHEVAQNFVCRFPARSQWILNRLGKNSTGITLCPEVEKWKKELRPASISLAIPSTSFQSTLSVFSHTFLLLESEGLPPSSSLKTVISFGAALGSQQHSLLELAVRGIFGGYKGVFSTPGYYSEIVEYGYTDLRDIFEYQLDLTSTEIDRMLNFIWEAHGHSLKYYFLTGNCSSLLLSLIDIARPGLQLSDRFRGLVIPFATVQEVYWNTGLVRSIRNVPSRESQLQARFERMTMRSKLVYNDLRRTTVMENWDDYWETRTAGLTEEEQARVLEAYSLQLLGRTQEDALQNRSRALRERARLSVEPWPGPAEPSTSPPHLGHGPFRFSLGIRHDPAGRAGSISFRPAAHDFLNLAVGHNNYSEVIVFEGGLRLQANRLKFDHLTFLRVTSLLPQMESLKIGAWTYRGMVESASPNPVYSGLNWINDGARGWAWEPVLGITTALMASVHTTIYQDQKTAYRFGAGIISLSIFRIGPQLNASLELNPRQYFRESAERDFFWQAGASWSLSRLFDFRLIVAEEGRHKKVETVAGFQF